jgi:quinoprotein dehydrogenase-associated probable ABC transporter substrate-binding protein
MLKIATRGLLLALGLVGYVHAPQAPRELRVCADPNNLPFSNRREEGLENRIARLIAADLGIPLRYTWWPQRRGFIRNTLTARKCDVVMGTPPETERVLTTRPYYRSTYVFVSRKDRGLNVRSLNDPVLRRLRIGVQLVGDDYANTPPVHALSRRRIVGNLVGYSVFGDYSQENPPARIVDAVAAGAVDLAIVWGPLAGYFAKHSAVELEVVPVSPAEDPPSLRFRFDISIAVRPGEQALKAALEAVLDRKKAAIDAILTEYGVPLVTSP